MIVGSDGMTIHIHLTVGIGIIDVSGLKGGGRSLMIHVGGAGATGAIISGTDAIGVFTHAYLFILLGGVGGWGRGWSIVGVGDWGRGGGGWSL